MEVLQPAMQGWLNVAASGAAQGDTLQRYYILCASILSHTSFWIGIESMRMSISTTTWATAPNTT